MMRATRDPRLDPLVARGLVLLVVSVLLLHWAFLGNLPFLAGPDGRVVRLEVTNAVNLNGRTPVRIAGADVGKVERIEGRGLAPRAMVVARIHDDGVRLHEDATAAVRYRTLMGGSMYVDVDPGSPSAPPLGDRPIPLSRTSVQVDWDEFNSVFAEPVPRAQRQVIKGLMEVFAKPKLLRDVIRRAGPALESLGRASRATRGTQAGQLLALIRASGRVARGIGADGRSLGDQVDGAGRFFAATARVRSLLGESAERVPAVLRSTRASLREVDRLLAEAEPLTRDLEPGLRQLQPTVRRLRPALEELNRLLVVTKPLSRDTPPALRSLRRSAEVGLPMLVAVNRVTKVTNRDLVPWLDTKVPTHRMRVAEMFGPFLSANNSRHGSYDRRGHFVRTGGRVGPSSIVTKCDIGDLPVEQLACLMVTRVARSLARTKRVGAR